jgi:fatty-acyl-CoA synthase
VHPGAHARRDPDRVACIFPELGITCTYGELDRGSNRFAHLFREAGARRGDHVAFVLGNEPTFYEVAFGAHRAGLYYTPINTRTTPEEMAYIVRDSGAKVLVASARALSPDFAQDVAARLGDVPQCVWIGDDGPGWPQYDAIEASLPTNPIDDESTGRDMLYSSGTTGRPKGVELPLPDTPLEETVISFGDFGLRLWSFGPDMRYLSPAPLHHAAPLRGSMSVLQLGGLVVCMQHFEPVLSLELLEQHAITHSQWVPTMFVRMLRLDDRERRARDLSAHRVAIHAAAPCPVEVKRQMIDWWGPILFEYYSATEGPGLTAIDSPDWLRHPGSVGRAVYGEPHILDDDGNELGSGEVGTVYFGGGNDFRYHNDPEKTAASRDSRGRGWATVGDMGYLDPDGYLYLTDRSAHLVISGGVNIYPREVEDVLITHPAVADVAAIGVPDDDLGERLVAVVQLEPGVARGPETAAELLSYCRDRLAHYKCPRAIEFSDDLPRQATGKMNKHELVGRFSPSPSP